MVLKQRSSNILGTIEGILAREIRIDVAKSALLSLVGDVHIVACIPTQARVNA